VKPEAAKVPGAGIGPKQCPGNEWQKKMGYRHSVESVRGNTACSVTRTMATTGADIA
jgi:hypothetical protein